MAKNYDIDEFRRSVPGGPQRESNEPRSGTEDPTKAGSDADLEDDEDDDEFEDDEDVDEDSEEDEGAVE